MGFGIYTGGTTGLTDGTLVSASNKLTFPSITTVLDAHIRCGGDEYSAQIDFDNIPSGLEISFNAGGVWYGIGEAPFYAATSQGPGNSDVWDVNYPIKLRQVAVPVTADATFTTDGTVSACTALSTPTLTATVRGNTQIDLSWTNVANEDASPGYTLDRSTAANFSANLVSVTKDANVTTHSATGLSAGTRYYFRVKAEGSGRYSDSAYGTDDDTTAPTIAEAILALSPLTYYKLDENSGTNLNDSGSLNNDATLSGGVTLAQTGPRGAADAVLIDSANERIEAPNASSLRFTGTSSFSIVFFIRTNATTDANTRAVLNQCEPVTGLKGWDLYLETDGRLGVGRYDNTGSLPFYEFDNNTTALTGATWHCVTITYDGTNWRWYIDGSLDATTAAAHSIAATSTQALQIGNYVDAYNDNPLNGRIAHVAFFNSVLSLANHQAINSAG